MSFTSRPNFSNSILNYGTSLPTGQIADGSMFFLTTGPGSTPGLYVYSFKQDTASTTPGEQVGMAWQLLATTGTINADTLDGLDSTAFQPIDADLTAIAAMNGIGFAVRTGTNTWNTRSLAAGLGISLSNTNAAVGDVTIGVVESALSLPNFSGILPVAKGGTGNAGVLTPGGVWYSSSSSVMANTVAGTAGQVLLSGGGGAPTWSSATTTIGTTAIPLNGSATVLAGLSQVTSATFIGALSGNATSATSLILGSSQGTIQSNMWAGTAGYPGFAYTGGNYRFGFSSSSGVIDVYTDGNFYANEGNSLVLHSANFNSYAPTLTGGNASGTWGINITGSAAQVGGMVNQQFAWRPVNGGLNGAQRLVRAGFIDGSNDYSFSVMPTWDGTYWRLRGYNSSDALHAETRVGYADVAYRLNGPASTNGTDGWFRSTGNTGWYNSDYNVGVYATEAGNVRTYNGSNLLAQGLYPGYDVSRGFRMLSNPASNGSVDVVGATGSWTGLNMVNGGNVVVGMYNSSRNGGTWDNVTGWHFYWDAGNGCLALGGSNTVAGYRAMTNGSHYVAGNLYNTGRGDFGSYVSAVGFHANQGTPNNNDSSTNGYAFGADGDTGMFSPGSGNGNGVVAFYSNNIEAMRIDAGLNVGIGIAPSLAKLHVAGDILSTTQISVRQIAPQINFRDTTNLGAILQAQSAQFRILRPSAVDSTIADSGPNGRNPMVISMSTGDATFSGDVIAYSDRRMKREIQPITSPMWRVGQLNGVTYKKLDTEKIYTGLIAQDVQEVMPEAVSEDADGMLAVSYGNLAGLLVEALKEQQTEIDELKAKVAQLMAVVETLVGNH